MCNKVNTLNLAKYIQHTNVSTTTYDVIMIQMTKS